MITVNLPGRLGPPVKHTTEQKCAMRLLSPNGTAEYISRKILHTDREPLPCIKQISISADVVSYWERGECPSWHKPQIWKKLNAKQRVDAYVATFSEGLGAFYE